MTNLQDPEFVLSIPTTALAHVTSRVLGISKFNNKFIKCEFHHRGIPLEVIVFEPDGEDWLHLLFPGDLVSINGIRLNNNELYSNSLRARATSINAQPTDLLTAIKYRRDEVYHQLNQLPPVPQIEPVVIRANPEPETPVVTELPQNTHRCLHCSTPFTSKRSSAKYCSKLCSQEAYKNRAALITTETERRLSEFANRHRTIGVELDLGLLVERAVTSWLAGLEQTRA